MELTFRRKLRRVLFKTTAEVLGMSPTNLMRIIVRYEDLDQLEPLVPTVFASTQEVATFFHLHMMAELSYKLPDDFDLADFNATYDHLSLAAPGTRGLGLLYTNLLKFKDARHAGLRAMEAEPSNNP